MIPQIIVVGAVPSRVDALQELLSRFPSRFPVPIAVAMHRDGRADEELCERLRQASRLPIGEPEDKEVIAPGRIYLAPSDYHLLIERGYFALSLAPPVEEARPSANMLFESAAEAYREGVIGIILTGAGRVAARGLAQIKRRGGMAIVEETMATELHALPEVAWEAAEVDQALSLGQMAAFLSDLCPAIVRS